MAHAINEKADQLLDKEFKVLDHGFVRLVDYMGDDQAIVQAARVSYGEGTRKVSEDRGLIRYLMRHRHTSPLEMVEFKFHVKLPIFVARQWIRHRTANVNELSGRYSIMKEEFYRPDTKDIGMQSTDNKQGRTDDADDALIEKFLAQLDGSQSESYQKYQSLVDDGLARELARISLPLSLYTEWYWKIDLHNLFHFLRLRLDRHAQKEIRVYAEVMAEMVRAVCPISYEAFDDYVANAHTFSGPEMELLRELRIDQKISDEQMKSHGLSKREGRELMDKLDPLRSGSSDNSD